MFSVVFYQPRIPQNSGNAIRLAAVTGCELHLIEPLGFDMSDAKLRRAGLDYHDLAVVSVHPDLVTAWSKLLPARVFAFSSRGTMRFSDVVYERGDVFLFGPEPSGLPDNVLNDPNVSGILQIPMLPARRSLNLANSAAIVVYEAWRQNGFTGAKA